MRLQVAAHMRLDEGVDQRRHRAFVFAVFGQHVAGQRDDAAGKLPGENFPDAALVRRIGVGVQQTDAEGGDARPAVIARRRANRVLIERPQLFAAIIEPAADLANVAERDDAVRLDPKIGVAVALGDRLAGDLQDMPEAFGDDQAEAFDPALQQRIGGDRGAVGETGEIVKRRVAKDRAHAADEADGRVGRRACDFGHAHRAGHRIDAHDVGEGAAGVDADAQVRVDRGHGYRLERQHRQPVPGESTTKAGRQRRPAPATVSLGGSAISSPHRRHASRRLPVSW